MYNWKKSEMECYRSALLSADRRERAIYLRFKSLILDFLKKMNDLEKKRFEEKRTCLEGHLATLPVPTTEKERLCLELARSWNLVAVHARRDEDSWHRELSNSLKVAGILYQQSGTVESFLWSWSIGRMLEVWQQGVCCLLEHDDGWTKAQEYLPMVNTNIAFHPSIRALKTSPAILEYCYDFLVTDEERERWQYAGGRLFGRLLYTHALSVGVTDLGASGLLHAELATVNGAIAEWPQPIAKDRDFTCDLLRKWGVEYKLAVCRPSYFISDEWGTKLLSASREYLDSYAILFCKKRKGGDVEADNWKRLGECLQTFSQPVLTYEIND